MLLSAVLCTLLAQVEQTPLSNLTIRLVSMDGNSLGAGRITVKPANGPALEKASEVATFTVPYGTYQISVRADWIESTQRTVVIQRPQTFVLIASSGKIIEQAQPNSSWLSVKVLPLPSCRQGGSLTARLFALYGDRTEERQVTSLGLALFEPLPPGPYSLAILDGSYVRAMRVVEIGKPRILDVELSHAIGGN